MPPDFSWQHVVTEAALGSIPVLVGLWFSHRASSKEADRREQKREFIYTEYPPHAHAEDEGLLKAENIRFPKVRVNGK